MRLDIKGTPRPEKRLQVRRHALPAVTSASGGRGSTCPRHPAPAVVSRPRGRTFLAPTVGKGTLVELRQDSRQPRHIPLNAICAALVKPFIPVAL